MFEGGFSRLGYNKETIMIALPPSDDVHETVGRKVTDPISLLEMRTSTMLYKPYQQGRLRIDMADYAVDSSYTEALNQRIPQAVWSGFESLHFYIFANQDPDLYRRYSEQVFFGGFPAETKNPIYHEWARLSGFKLYPLDRILDQYGPYGDRLRDHVKDTGTKMPLT